MNDAWLAAVLNCRYRFCQRYNGSIFFLALLLLLLFFFLLLLFLSMLIFPIHLRLYGQVECRNLSRYRSPAAIGHCQLWRHRAGLLLFRWSSFLSHFYFIYFYFLHLFVSFLFVSCFVCFFVFFLFFVFSYRSESPLALLAIFLFLYGPGKNFFSRHYHPNIRRFPVPPEVVTRQSII